MNKVPGVYLLGWGGGKGGGSIMSSSTCAQEMRVIRVLTFMRRIINTTRSPEIFCLFALTGQLGIFWNSDCEERNAECSKWKQLCVCHCDPEYSMTNGHCIQGKIKWMIIYLIILIHLFCKSNIISYFYLKTCNDYTSLLEMIV